VRRKQRCRVSKKKTKTKMQMQAHARLNCHVKYFHEEEGVGMSTVEDGIPAVNFRIRFLVHLACLVVMS